MEHLNGFLEYLAKYFPVAVCVAGLLAFFFREKVKQVLSRVVLEDVERLKGQIAKDIANHTASLHRELEAYKVSLIAEAERVKAQHDVRKSLALRIAEKRFMAIAGLLDAHLGIDTDVGSLATTEYPDGQVAERMFNEERSRLIDRMAALGRAGSAASPFVDLRVRQLLGDSRRALMDVMAIRDRHTSPCVAEDDPRLARLLQAGNALEIALRRVFEDMERFSEEGARQE